MKIFNITFSINRISGDKTMSVALSMLVAADTATAAKQQAKDNIREFGGRKPQNLKANVIVHGVDGTGKSLNKLKKKR